MKFCDEKIQKHLLNGGKIIYSEIHYPLFLDKYEKLSYKTEDNQIKRYPLTKDDLTANDWEIVELEYNWDKIIKDKVLCVFSDDKDFKDEIISILTNFDNDYYYTTNGLWFKHCKLFNPLEFNIAKDLKDYEK